MGGSRTFGRQSDWRRNQDFYRQNPDAAPPVKGMKHDAYVSSYNTQKAEREQKAAASATASKALIGNPADADKSASLTPTLPTATIGEATAMGQPAPLGQPAPTSNLGSVAPPAPAVPKPATAGTPPGAPGMSGAATTPIPGSPTAVQGQLNGVAATSQTGLTPGTAQNPNAQMAARANQQIAGGNTFAAPSITGLKFGGS